jgi:hypothetical protein
MSPSVVEELSHSVEKVGREMVDDALRERGGAQPDVPVEIIALGGSPGHVLVEQSREAPGGAAQERRTVAADQETRANGRRVTAVTRDRLGHLLKSRWV